MLQDEFRAGSSDSPRISTRTGPGRAEPGQTLENLWTAWHCSAGAGSGPEPQPGAGVCMRLAGESAAIQSMGKQAAWKNSCGGVFLCNNK